MIFCFSGCGNTAAVANTLAHELGEKVVDIGVENDSTFNLAAHKRVIWAFPIYSWGLPVPVRGFIESVRLDGADRLPHFMVATCGDDAGLADKSWRKLLRKRGWKSVSAHTVIMPNTYVSLPGFDTDSKPIADEKLQAAPERVSEIARSIRCQSPIDNVTRGKMPWLKTRIIYPFFMRFLCSPQKFKASDECNGCGNCSRNCPTRNINIVNGHPQWGNRCAMCLGCYHRCPKRCIAYGAATKGKGHYICPVKNL